MATLPFKVKAIYEYASEHDDDLTFAPGQIINVTELEGDDWYVGEYVDGSGARKEGLFPANFVEKYEPEVPTRPNRLSKPKQEKEAHSSPFTTTAEAVTTVTDSSELASDGKAISTTAKEQDVEAVHGSMSQKNDAFSEDRPDDLLVSQEKPATRETIVANPATDAKPVPPPVAPKSSSFKDRIAAFNKFEQAPIKPFQPGRQAPAGGFVKKPFVPPPPSGNTYIPHMQKAEPVHLPYHREEDPEIREKVEQNQAAAEAAGLAGLATRVEEAETEETPKPLSLKERMALLQEQQRLQAERNAEAAQRKDRKAAAKNPLSSEGSNISNQPEEAVDKISPGAGSGDNGAEDLNQDPKSEATGPRTSMDTPANSFVPQHKTPTSAREPERQSIGEGSDGRDNQGDNADNSDDSSDDDDDDDETIALEHEQGALRSHGGASHPVNRETDSQEVDAGHQNEDVVDEIDEEELRKQRLRERMARLAGPQGGAAMPFNPFAPSLPVAIKKQPPRETRTDESQTSSSTIMQAQAPVPQNPEMGRAGSSNSGRGFSYIETGGQRTAQANSENSPASVELPFQPRESGEVRSTANAISSVPREPPLPPPRASGEYPSSVPLSDTARSTTKAIPPKGRPAPPPPRPSTSAPLSPGPGSESDDEMSMHAKRSSAETSGVETPLPLENAASPSFSPIRAHPEHEMRAPGFESGPGVAVSSSAGDRGVNRAPPPIPGSAGSFSRPAPPPPPDVGTAVKTNWDPARSHLEDDDEDDGGSDYEGDYDTDIASGAKHKDALKAHIRESSLDEISTAERSELPVKPAPRSVPPPPPHGHSKAKSPTEQQRAPPPVPSAPPQPEEYDPYRYKSSSQAIPDDRQNLPPRPPIAVQEESSADESIPLRHDVSMKAPEKAPLPPPHEDPSDAHANAQSSSFGRSGQDMGPTRQLSTGHNPPPSLVTRRSIDQGRVSGESGQMARDVDLRLDTTWWTAQRPLPPALQTRDGVDILSESEESVTSRRGGRSLISKDIYILYMDYSQTVLTVRYDAREPSDASIEQRHEAPPGQLRQDQLESYWSQFGSKIGQAARASGGSKKESILGDGTPQALPLELIKPLAHALLPVGARAYGALVYANLANASTMQFDEIRSGDVMTLRNARFEGHHGAIKQKYKSDYGTNHIAIVDEWDGTKRSVRAWEQGRDKKAGVRSEKFRLGDLRSGEVRVWRVVGRDWIGWDDSA